MKLYIETENGQVKNHPAFEDNLIQAFGAIPPHWELFVRTPRPPLSFFKVLISETPIYQKVNGVWTDIWAERDTTEAERAVHKQNIMTAFFEREYSSNWSAWSFDASTFTMQPPVPMPTPAEGVTLLWCGADNNWKEAPTRPEGEYKFNFIAWAWVAL
jgi:hypothetical protein